MLIMNPKEILALMKSTNKTQEEFAHLIGTTVTTVNRWINGKSKPSKIYIKIMKELLEK